MNRSPIRIDPCPYGYVVACAECGHWSAFLFGKEAARARAIEHEELVHPERREQREARKLRGHRTRHAV